MNTFEELIGSMQAYYQESQGAATFVVISAGPAGTNLVTTMSDDTWRAAVAFYAENFPRKPA